MAKLHCTDTAMQAGRSTRWQLAGEEGAISGRHFERATCATPSAADLEGSNQVQRIVIARRDPPLKTRMRGNRRRVPSQIAFVMPGPRCVNLNCHMDFEFTQEPDRIREHHQGARPGPSSRSRAAEISTRAEYPKDIRLFAENGILGIPFRSSTAASHGSSVTICMGIEEIANGFAPFVADLGRAGPRLVSHPSSPVLRSRKSAICPPLARRTGRTAYALSRETGLGRTTACA